MKKVILLIIFLMTTNSLVAQSCKDSITHIVLKDAFIIDAIENSPKKGTIFIHGDKIEKVDYKGSQNISEGARVFNLAGKFIIPGLIDGHVHISHDEYNKIIDNLEITLKNGVTSIRDMGGDARILNFIKRGLSIGEILGPDLYFSTVIADSSFFKNDPRPKQVAKGVEAGKVPWLRAIHDKTDLKQIIAEAKGIGATAIKIYANINKDLMLRLSNEALKQGLKVWSHAAIPPTRPSEVSNSKVQVMSHAGDIVQYELVDSLIDRHAFNSNVEKAEYEKQLEAIYWNSDTPKVKRLFGIMKENNTILDATLYIYYHLSNDRAILDYYKKNNIPINNFKHKSSLKTTKIAYDMGIKIGAGTDHMISNDKTVNIHNELELLVKSGLSNIDALKAATIINAEILGQDKKVGSIEKGKIADLIVLNSNPLENISNTKDIMHVIKKGKIIR